MNKSILFSLVLSSLAFAEKDPASSANSLFEAGAYQKAIEAYTGLLKVQSGGVKKEVLTYNIGTAHLANHEYQSALSEFEKVLTQEERAPKYLITRTLYNVVLASLGKADESLDHISEEKPMESVETARVYLDRAQDKLSQFIELKYPDLDAYLDVPEEVLDIKKSMKELNSKYRKVREKVILDTLTFSAGLDLLVKEEHFSHGFLSQLLQKSGPKDQEKYVLSKRFTVHKKSFPYWKRVEEILKENLEKAEQNAQHKDKVSQMQDEELETMRSHLALFDQAYNRHLCAGDALKEGRLDTSRLEIAKAKLDLDLIKLSEMKRDGIEHCLQGKIALKEKQEEVEKWPSYAQALEEEIAHYTTMVYGLVHGQCERIQAYKSKDPDKKQFAKLDEMKKVKELDMVQQMLMKLRARLKNETVHTQEKFLEDYYLYQVSKVQPEDILLGLYDQLFKEKQLKQAEQQEAHYQLFALGERFDIQSQFSYDAIKTRKLSYAKEKLPEVKALLAQKEWARGHTALKDLLINFSLQRFAMNELTKISNNVRDASLEPFYTEEQHARLLSQMSELHNLSDQLKYPQDHERALASLNEDLEHAETHLRHALKDAYPQKVQKLFVEHGGRWIERAKWHLDEDEKKAMEILSKGITEEKHTLKFSTLGGHLVVPDPEYKTTFVDTARSSQHYTVSVVNPFLDAFYSEQAESNALTNEPGKKDEVIKYFKAGLVEAEEAERLLHQENLDFEKIQSKQELTLEYWQKALEALSGNSSNSNQQNQGNSSQGNSQEAQAQPSNEQPEEGENMSQASSGDESDQGQELREILQALQEMQQDDQIRKDSNREAKKGLRPW